MRIDRMTSKLQVALSDAQSMAVGRDHAQIDPLHLLLALIEQQHGSVKPLLMQVGFDIAALRAALGEALERLPTVSNPAGAGAPAESGRSPGAEAGRSIHFQRAGAAGRHG